MGYLSGSTNVRWYQTHHRWHVFLWGRHRCIVCVTQSNWVKMWFSCFPILTASAEAQIIWGGIVKHILIAYFIGNISAKKYQNPFVCIKVIASQRWDVFETRCIYIGWQWRNFFISAVFRHFVGHALRNVCCSDVSRRHFLNKIAIVRTFVNEQRIIAFLTEKCCYLNLRSKVRTQLRCSTSRSRLDTYKCLVSVSSRSRPLTSRAHPCYKVQKHCLWWSTGDVIC